MKKRQDEIPLDRVLNIEENTKGHQQPSSPDSGGRLHLYHFFLEENMNVGL